MAVLMTYHKLIERDNKNIDWFWKYGTIFFMLLTVACCMAASYSFYKITYAYDDHCILNAEILFKSSEAPKPSETVSITSSFAETSSSGIQSDELPNEMQKLSEKYPEIAEKERKFLENQIIDVTFSAWGDRTQCDWALYLPIFQTCFGIILVSFFVICGKGGKADEGSFLMQPWRIVSPSFVFFLVMLLISIIHISFVHPGMDNLCNNLTLPTPTISCYDAINLYKIRPTDYDPHIFYGLLIYLDWVVFVMWLALAIIMLCRIIFVIDFQLVRVTIRTCEHENTHEKTSFKVIEKRGTENGNKMTTTTQC